MIKKNFIKQLFLIVFSICSLTVSGQVLSGEIGAFGSSRSSKKSLGYANIDIVTDNNTDIIVPQDVVELQWKFYPNPTTGIINIVANKEIEQLYISDLSGKVLQVITNINPNETVTANLSGYASGIYLIRYSLGKQWISGKIMLVR